MSFLHHTTVFISSHRHSVAVWHWAFPPLLLLRPFLFPLAYVRFHGRPVFLRQNALGLYSGASPSSSGTSIL